MKARLLSFDEIEGRLKEVQIELAQHPVNEDSVLEMGRSIPFMVGLCISQMKAFNAASYPGKAEHVEILENASKLMTYSINTCTMDEIRVQVTNAYNLFQDH